VRQTTWATDTKATGWDVWATQCKTTGRQKYFKQIVKYVPLHILNIDKHHVENIQLSQAL